MIRVHIRITYLPKDFETGNWNKFTQYRSRHAKKPRFCQWHNLQVSIKLTLLAHARIKMPNGVYRGVSIVRGGVCWRHVIYHVIYILLISFYANVLLRFFTLLHSLKLQYNTSCYIIVLLWYQLMHKHPWVYTNYKLASTCSATKFGLSRYGRWL